MEQYLINGGNKLFGEVQISPAKNACLPIIASSIMFNGKIALNNAPKILDVAVMAEIIKDLGGEFNFNGKNLLLKTSNITSYHPSKEICTRARASFFIVGALLSRFKRAVVPLPGGCNLGIRPVDVHIDALNQLGVKCELASDFITFDASNIKSGKVYLRYPSVGATVNAICACAGLTGESYIFNCAKEPEIVDLCNFLVKCGAKIEGMGSSSIKIQGQKDYNEVNLSYLPIQDRIEAGTFLFATALTGGEILFKYDEICHICSVVKLIEQMGAKVFYERGILRLVSNKNLVAIRGVADVFPAFPTDLQSQLCAICSYAKGESVITDMVFKNRFAFVKQLKEFGVKAKVNESTAYINGCNDNKPCVASALDLRAGAGLVLYALGANGQSKIGSIDIIRRGYECFDEKLKILGADIRCISTQNS